VAQTDPPAASVPADAVTEPAAGTEVQPATGDNAAPPAASDPPEAVEPQRKPADQRIKELIAERNALRALVAQTPPAKPAAAEAPKPAEPEKPPAIEDFDDVNKWSAAFAAYTKREAAAEAQTAVRTALGKVETERAQQTTQQAFAEREAAYARENPDYAEAVGDQSLGQYVTQTISQVIVESEVGPALSHHLATHLDELQRIARLQPHQQAKELGKLEVKIAALPKRQAAPPAKVVQQTKAPAPPSPVGSATPTRSIAEMPLDEYLANRPWAHRN
jgi:signal recognition particle GTPase